MALKDNFLRLIDNGATQAKSFVENFNDLVNSFDFDAHVNYFNERKKELIKRSGELFSDFTELLKQVKDSLADFSVTVPFDESIGEKLSYEIQGNKLKIEVVYNDENSSRCNTTVVNIPSNCNLEALEYTTNKLAQTATITIPKVIIERSDDEEPKEEAKTEEVKVKAKVKTKKSKNKVTKKTKVTIEEEKPTPTTEEEKKEEEEAAAPEVEEENPMVTISKKLAKNLQRNMSKYTQTLKRDENGRFVRRTPSK